MSIENLQLLSFILYIVSAVFFVLAIILFFALKIPKTVGSLSGSTARKAIKSIREQNQQGGEKAYKPRQIANANNVYESRSVDNTAHPSETGFVSGTAKLATAQLVREAEETSLLQSTAEETTVLDNGNSVGTTVLNQEVFSGFAIEYELEFLGCNEIIA